MLGRASEQVIPSCEAHTAPKLIRHRGLPHTAEAFPKPSIGCCELFSAFNKVLAMLAEKVLQGTS